MRDRFWDRYITSVVARKLSPKQKDKLLAVLATWEAESPASEKFLEELTRRLSPGMLQECDDQSRYEILMELTRIDNGRGKVLPWIAALVKYECNVAILEKISEWALKKKIEEDIFWEAWEIRGKDPWAEIRQAAWKFLVTGSRNLSGAAELSGGNASQREIWLAKRIVEHLPGEFHPAVLTVLAGWQPSPDLPSSLSNQLWQEWEKKIPAGKGSENWFRICWQGLMGASVHWSDNDDSMASIITGRLSPATDSGTLRVIAKWRPKHGRIPTFLLLLWSKLLLAKDMDVQAVAWQVMGEESEENDSGLDSEIWGNCLAGLRLILKTDMVPSFEFLCGIVQPSGLSREQRAEWQKQWMEILSFTNRGYEREGAVIHLLRFGDPSLPGGETLDRQLLDTVNALLDGGTLHYFEEKLISVIESGLSPIAGRKGQENNYFVNLSTEILQCLSVRGEHHSREKVIKMLAPQEMSVLPEETDPEEKINLKKKLATDTNPNIRRHAWESLAPMGNEIAEFLLHRLATENSDVVLESMVAWRPSADAPLPAVFWAEFWNQWGSALIRISHQNHPVHYTTRMENIFIKNLLELACQNSAGYEGFQRFLKQVEKEGTGFFQIVGICQKMLEIMSYMESPPEVFWHQLEDRDNSLPNQTIRRQMIDWLYPEANHSWDTYSVHRRMNFFLLATVVLWDVVSDRWCDRYGYGYDYFTYHCGQKSLELMRRWCCTEVPVPDTLQEFPAEAWNKIGNILAEVMPVGKVGSEFLGLIKVGHELPVPALKKAFLRILEEVRQTDEHPLARFMDSVLWREICVAREMVQPWLNAGSRGSTVIDPVAERRWLREWIHTFCPEKINAGENRGRLTGVGRNWGAILWESTGLPSDCAKHRKFNVNRFCPAGMERFFHDPRRRNDPVQFVYPNGIVPLLENT